MKCRALPLAALLLTAACAAQDTAYPSLAPRTIEGQGFAEPDVPAPGPVPNDPALDARIATANTALARAAERFEAAADRTASMGRAARGQMAGSEAWIEAQMALADLDALRADSLDTLTAFETMASDRAQALLPAYPKLDRATAAAEATLAAQSARIATIQDALEP